MRIQVPTTLNDITLGQYQRFMEANKEGADQDFLLFKTIEVFCDVDMKTVSQFPIEDAQDIAAEVNAILSQTSEFQRHFSLGGVEYGFIPDMEAMTIGEYIDLESGMGDPKQFHKAAAVMYRPVKRRFKDLYTIEAYSGSNHDINKAKEFPMGAISAGFVFFYNIANELLEDSPLYLKELLEKISTTQESPSSIANGDGLILSTTSVVDAQQIIKQQQK